jgi:peptidoglycan hydrolase CwlO-like protein
VNELTKQLQQVLQEKANLEGQLESIIEECQSTLKERASLQSKLTKAEVDLQSFQDETTAW